MELNATPSKSTARYQLQSLTGEGGGGSVYCAWDTQLSRAVAIKRLKTDMASDASQAALQEAMRLATFHHPNIVAVHDIGQDEEGAYVVMEFIQGETVDQIVTRGTFPLDDFVHLAEQSLEGLIAAHHSGLVHRDLKPANLMLTWLPSGAFQVKILDFGIAKFITAPTAQTVAVDGTVYGSILTMAPEQFGKCEIDARTDLYSLGCTFYAALTGATPFTGDTPAEIIAAHLHGQAVPLQTLRPDLPPAICDWVARLFALNPDDRFASAGAALNALREIVSGKTPTTAAVPVPPVQRAKKMVPIVIGAVIAVMVCGAILWWLTMGKSGGQASQAATKRGQTSSGSVIPPGSGIFDAHDLAGLRKHVGEKVTVEGRVVSATKNKTLNVRNLSFDLDGKNAVSLVFPLDSGGHFSKEALGAYVDKRVRTTGVLESNEGALQIIVRNVSQLILVEESPAR